MNSSSAQQQQLTGDDYICSQMRTYTQKHGAVQTFYVAANQPQAADSTTETSVARVLAKSVCTQQPIKMGLHFFHPTGDSTEQQPLTTPIESDSVVARQITHSEVESPVVLFSKSEEPVKLPHDFQFNFSMKCDGVEATADGVNIGSVARLSSLSEPGDVYVVQHPLYAKSEYANYAAKQLPVSTALLKLRDRGERGVELVSARVVSNFLPAEQMDLHHYGVASTVGAVETMDSELSSVALGAEDDDFSVVDSPQKKLRSAIVSQFSKELGGEDDGSVHTRFALCMGHGDSLSDKLGAAEASQIPAFWGTATFALSCLSLCSMVASHAGAIWQERMRNQQYLLQMLGEEVAAGLRSVYAAYNAANQDAVNVQEAPTMEQLVLGTSGLPMRFMIGKKQEDELQERLISSLQAEHRGKLTPVESMEALQRENEKRLAYALTYGQVQMMRGPGEMPNDSPSTVEAALISVLLVSLMKQLKIDDEKVSESAILAGAHSLVDFDTRVDWNPLLSADGSSLRPGVGTSLLSAGSGLVSSLREAAKLPAAMSKTYEKVSGYLHSLKVSNELMHPNVSHIGGSWMESDLSEGLSLMATTIGEEGISAGAMFYIPQRNIWGVWQLDLRGMPTEESSSLYDRLLAALPQAITSYDKIEKDNGVFSAATRAPRFAPHSVRAPRAASSKKEKLLVRKKLNSIRTSSDRQLIDHVLTLCQSAPMKVALKLSEDGQRMHLVPSDQQKTTLGSFTYSPSHESFVEVNRDGSLGDLVNLNQEGVSFGGRFYSSSGQLSHHDELSKLVEKSLSTVESLDSERVLDSIFSESELGSEFPSSMRTENGDLLAQENPALLVSMIRDPDFRLNLDSVLNLDKSADSQHLGEHYYSSAGAGSSDEEEDDSDEDEQVAIGARRGGGGRGGGGRSAGRPHRSQRARVGPRRPINRRRSRRGGPRFGVAPRYRWRGGRRFVYRNGLWVPWVAAAAVTGGVLAMTDPGYAWGHNHRSHHPFAPWLVRDHPHYVHHQIDGYSPYI